MAFTFSLKKRQINLTEAGTAFQYPSWLTGTYYSIGDTVLYGNTIWTCTYAHTDGTFTTDWLTGDGGSNKYWINDTDAPGSIRKWGNATASNGYLICDGSSVLRATYATLYAVIGTTFGSADGTHFNLPDFRGRGAIGIGTGTGGQVAIGTGAPTGGSALTARTIGQWTGEENHILSVGELASHGHALTHNFSCNSTGIGYPLASATGSYSEINEAAATGSNTPHYNIQPILVVNYIIKY